MEKKYSSFRVTYKDKVIVNYDFSFFIEEEFKEEALKAVRNYFLKYLRLEFKEKKVWKENKAGGKINYDNIL